MNLDCDDFDISLPPFASSFRADQEILDSQIAQTQKFRDVNGKNSANIGSILACSFLEKNYEGGNGFLILIAIVFELPKTSPSPGWFG